MNDFPYFQVMWNSDGACTHVVSVLVSEERYEELVTECFGETQEEVFKISETIRRASLNATKFGKFLKRNEIPFRLETLKQKTPTN